MADTASGDLTSALPPQTAYAIRAWYTSVLGQTHQVRSDLVAQIDRLQSEIERVEQQLEGCDKSIDALGNVLDTVDDWIRKLTEEEQGATKSSTARKTTGSRRAATGRSTCRGCWGCCGRCARCKPRARGRRSPKSRWRAASRISRT